MHKEETGQISAPLILDPTAGELTTKLKEACRRLEAASGLHVTLRDTPGNSMRKDARPDPIRRKKCGRMTFLCSSTGINQVREKEQS